jgi:hypothetical protein
MKENREKKMNKRKVIPEKIIEESNSTSQKLEAKLEVEITSTLKNFRARAQRIEMLYNG